MDERIGAHGYSLTEIGEMAIWTEECSLCGQPTFGNECCCNIASPPGLAQIDGTTVVISILSNRITDLATEVAELRKLIGSMLVSETEANDGVLISRAIRNG